MSRTSDELGSGPFSPRPLVPPPLQANEKPQLKTPKNTLPKRKNLNDYMPVIRG